MDFPLNIFIHSFRDAHERKLLPFCLTVYITNYSYFLYWHWLVELHMWRAEYTTWVILSHSNQTLSGPRIYMYVYIGAFRIICHFAYADIWGNYSETDEILPPCISGCRGWRFPVGPQLMRWRIRLVILATARGVPTRECHISSYLYAHDTDTHAPTEAQTDNVHTSH